MDKHTVPEDFTLSLVLVDALPVLFFAVNMILIGLLFSSKLFVLGALLSFYAGACKVLWKLIVVLKRRNIWWMFLQMRYVMPIGLLCILVSVIAGRSRINLGAAAAAVFSFPACIFFALGLFGMILMGVFAVKLDSSDLRANWIEQLTNTAAQAAFFVGLVMLLR